jgi:hypothetical protein
MQVEKFILHLVHEILQKEFKLSTSFKIYKNFQFYILSAGVREVLLL